VSTEAFQNRLKAMIANAEKFFMPADFENLIVVTFSSLGSMIVRRHILAVAANQFEAVVRNLRGVR
jgi:hypothetical protein